MNELHCWSKPVFQRNPPRSDDRVADCHLVHHQSTGRTESLIDHSDGLTWGPGVSPCQWE